MRQIHLIITIFILLISCGSPKDPKYLGSTKTLPKGEYIIYNCGSRHLVKCVMPSGHWYYLNDNYFEINGIPGRDANQYRNKTRITIK